MSLLLCNLCGDIHSPTWCEKKKQHLRRRELNWYNTVIGVAEIEAGKFAVRILWLNAIGFEYKNTFQSFAEAEAVLVKVREVKSINELLWTKTNIYNPAQADGWECRKFAAPKEKERERGGESLDLDDGLYSDMD